MINGASKPSDENAQRAVVDHGDAVGFEFVGSIGE